MLPPVVVFTDRSHGDLATGSAGVDDRRQALGEGPWTWLRQVHGSRVVVVEHPGQHAGSEADAAVTASAGCVLAVQVADCAPVALLAPAVDGWREVLGVAHAGWRGLVAGVLPATVAAMRELGAGPIRATIGPCIEAGCYEFSAAELDAVALAVGAEVRSTTTGGSPALDVPAAVRASLASVGVTDVVAAGPCTACSPAHWSHRGAADGERQALVAWL